jgi:predicted nucleic acid-binding protein
LILYLDASALVKLYAAEQYREQVQQGVREADLIVSALIVYAKARAAFWRKERDGDFSVRDHAVAITSLDEDVADRYVLLPIETNDVFSAGDLAAQHRLRGYDAVHLAAALNVHIEARTGSGGREDDEPQEVRLMTFDKDLYHAAKAEQFVYLLDAME